jgi:hypothetical protein
MGLCNDAYGDERPRLRATHNRWTAVGAPAQLRLGRDCKPLARPRIAAATPGR